MVVDRWSVQGTLWMLNNFFSFVFALCDKLLRLSSPGRLLKRCVYSYLSGPLECPCDIGVALIVFQSSFLRIVIGERRLFGKIFVSGLLVLYVTQLSSLGTSLL